MSAAASVPRTRARVFDMRLAGPKGCVRVCSAGARAGRARSGGGAAPWGGGQPDSAAGGAAGADGAAAEEGGGRGGAHGQG